MRQALHPSFVDPWITSLTKRCQCGRNWWRGERLDARQDCGDIFGDAVGEEFIFWTAAHGHDHAQIKIRRYLRADIRPEAALQRSPRLHVGLFRPLWRH